MIADLLRGAALPIDPKHLDVFVLRGGAENWLAARSLEAGCLCVASSLAVSPSAPLAKFLRLHPELASFLHVLVGVQDTARPGFEEDEKRPHLKFTIICTHEDDEVDAKEMAMMINLNEWSHAQCAVATVHTSNFNSFSTQSGDVLVGFAPKEGQEAEAQPALQALATAIATSGVEPEPQYVALLDQLTEDEAKGGAKRKRASPSVPRTPARSFRPGPARPGLASCAPAQTCSRSCF